MTAAIVFVVLSPQWMFQKVFTCPLGQICCFELERVNDSEAESLRNASVKLMPVISEAGSAS